MYTPVRAKNEVYRSREHLNLEEVTRLIEAAGERSRHRLGDRTLLLLMFRHGLRAGEAVILRWDAVMFDAGAISIKRLKRGESGVHRLQEDELKALGELREKYPESFYLFTSEQGANLSTDAISKIVDRAEKLAQLPLPVHPHMLRPDCLTHLWEPLISRGGR